MKKLMILAAIAATAMSCVKTYVGEPEAQSPIGFGTWTENMTKAITDPRTPGSNTFGVGDSFAVYGYKSASDDSNKSTVFDDVAVEMTVAGVPGTWIYSPTRFWDKTFDKYTFFAISPSSIGTQADGNEGSTNVDPQTGAFVTRAIAFAGDDNDILVADKKTVLNASYSSGPVQMYFNHVASLVDFKVNKATSLHDATVTVSAFSLDNIETTGKLSVSNAYNVSTFSGDGTTGPAVTWSSTASGSYDTTDGVTPVSLTSPIAIDEDLSFNPENPTTPGASTTLINTLIVKPQTFTAPTDRENPANASNNNAQKLTISYSISVTNGGTNNYTATLWLYDFDIVNDADQNDTKVASWAPGKHYTFYITLDAVPIVFGASINDWNTVTEGYHYLVN